MHESLETIYQQAATWLTQHYPFITNGLLFNDPTIDRSARQQAEQVLEYYLRKTQYSTESLQQGLTAFSKITFDFIRLQARFLKKGHYHHHSAAEVSTRLYLNSENMKGYYLDGLLLSYAFWPNHVHLMRFFLEHFLTTLSAHSHVGEIGTGHGLMALLTLRHLPTIDYSGIDISPFALEYASELLLKNEVQAHHFKLQQGDVMQPHSFFKQRFDAMICCEVLEHVETPEKILAVMAQALMPAGRVFITTVANIEAEDHIYLFTDITQIHDLFERQGFYPIEEQIYPLKGMEQVQPLPFNYVAVIAKREFS